MPCAICLTERGILEQRGVGCVAHVRRLDEHLGNGRQVEPAQVVAGVDTVVTEVRREGQARRGSECIAQLQRELGARLDDAVVVPGDEQGLDHVEAAPVGGSTVGVDGDGGVGVGVVADRGALGDARAPRG